MKIKIGPAVDHTIITKFNNELDDNMRYNKMQLSNYEGHCYLSEKELEWKPWLKHKHKTL